MVIIINQPHHFQLFHFTGCLFASPLGCISDASYPIQYCPANTHRSTSAKCISTHFLHLSSIYSSSNLFLSSTHQLFLEPLQVYLHLSICQLGQSVRTVFVSSIYWLVWNLIHLHGLSLSDMFACAVSWQGCQSIFKTVCEYMVWLNVN